MGKLHNAPLAVLGVVGMLLSWGCATPKVPSSPFSDHFAATPAGSDLYRLHYRGDASVSDQRILDFALASSSNLATDRGFRYFAVVDEQKSKPGEIYYAEEESLLGKVNPRELLIQCFPHRPKRIFSFRASYTARAMADKYGLNRTSPPS